MISERLRIASQFLKGYHYLADCGTDHALLPIYAIEKGYVKKAIASDNKNLPLMNAKDNINQKGLFLEVKTVLADGLSYLNLENEVDVVTILGMGGIVMKDILDKAYLYNVKRMVLQPNSHSELVRRFLEEHKWKIVDEVFIEDNKKYYQIIVCEKGSMILNDLEREFGPIILKKKPPLFIKRIESMIDHFNQALEQAKDSETKEKLNHRIAFLKGALA
ncbi:MAG: tRNA (adenine(22)-N(1))-methyltransferase TrmK [Candidatus Izemoplasmatales bacterium]